jgi:uracil-DNA glycosylase family 4
VKRRQSVSQEDGFVPGVGSGSAKLVVVGEAPAREEVRQQRPLVGPTGKVHEGLLRHLGVSRGELFETNAFPWRCPGDSIKNYALTGHSLEEGSELLWRDLKAIKPNCILSLGNHALTTLTGHTGISKWRGSILRSLRGGYKVVPTIHPAVLFKRGEISGAWPYQTKAYIALDYKRAIAESRTPEFNLPSRELVIARTSHDLKLFLKTYAHKKLCMLDIEVIKCIPICIALAFNRHHSLSVPLLPLAHLKGHTPMAKTDRLEMWRLLASWFESGVDVAGQNWKFDHEKLLRPCNFRIPRQPAHDTLILMHVLNPEFPKRLDFISSIYTREPYYKDEGRTFDPRKDSIDQYYYYNAKDSAVQMECLEEMLKEADERGLREYYETVRMPQHSFFMEMEQNGLPVDNDRRIELFHKYTDMELALEEKLFSLAGWKINVRSRTDVPLLLYKELQLPTRKKADEDTLVALLGNNLARDAELRQRQTLAINYILDLRRIKLSKTKIAAPLDYDNKMRTGFRLAGTETGRRSTSILKAPVRPHPMGLSFHGITKHGELGGDIRSMFVAPEGYEFAEFDERQAEARIVALLSDDLELLKSFDTIDVHKLTAKWIFGKKMEKISEDERFIGKAARHGGAYDMGKRRHMIEVNTNARRFGIDLRISEWRAGRNLETFHRYSPKIREIYHKDVQQAIENDRTLRNPYGGVRTFFDRWGQDLFREAYAHIPQSTVPDHLILAGFRVKKRLPWLLFSLEAHDSFTVLYRVERRDEVYTTFKEELEKEIDFKNCTLSRGKITIPMECKVGPNLKDLKTYELA